MHAFALSTQRRALLSIIRPHRAIIAYQTRNASTRQAAWNWLSIWKRQGDKSICHQGVQQNPNVALSRISRVATIPNENKLTARPAKTSIVYC